MGRAAEPKCEWPPSPKLADGVLVSGSPERPLNGFYPRRGADAPPPAFYAGGGNPEYWKSVTSSRPWYQKHDDPRCFIAREEWSHLWEMRDPLIQYYHPLA